MLKNFEQISYSEHEQYLVKYYVFNNLFKNYVDNFDLLKQAITKNYLEKL